MTPICRRKAQPQSRGGGYMAAPSYPPRDRYPASSSAPYPQPSYSPQPATPAAAAAWAIPGQFGDRLRAGRGQAGRDTRLSDRSALDRWLADSVQPAAMRWFGARVVEIKQISAYSCRGMNGNSHAHISEHAFGNALDIAAFTLADGRRVSVKDGWSGMPEEQGFLRDVQAARASSSPRCWRRARTSITTIISTST